MHGASTYHHHLLFIGFAYHHYHHAFKYLAITYVEEYELENYLSQNRTEVTGFGIVKFI